MKKVILLVLIAVLSCGVCYADVFGPAPVQKQKADINGVPVDAGTLISEITAAANYLGVREGAIYDTGRREFCNYAAATAYTFQNPIVPIAIDFGAVNLDGAAITADANIGAAIPAQGVPIAGALQYLYVGGGIMARNLDKSDTDPTKVWKTSLGVDVCFKGTF